MKRKNTSKKQRKNNDDNHIYNKDRIVRVVSECCCPPPNCERPKRKNTGDVDDEPNNFKNSEKSLNEREYAQFIDKVMNVLKKK